MYEILLDVKGLTVDPQLLINTKQIRFFKNLRSYLGLISDVFNAPNKKHLKLGYCLKKENKSSYSGLVR